MDDTKASAKLDKKVARIENAKTTAKTADKVDD